MGTQNGKRDPVEIITTDLAEQPVIRAWRTLLSGTGAAALPERIEMLRQRPKSVVYRLPAVGHARADVIAKHCVRESALAESNVYTVLRGLPVTHPDYYGYVEGEREGFGWLFLGDAAGEAFVPEDPAQRRAATLWLAALHATSSGDPGAALLPDRGPAHYLAHLCAGREAIARIRASRETSAAEDDILDDVRTWLDRIEARWEDIEVICRAMPRALVHGDFAARNVHVRHHGTDGVALLVFDWEVAGWGMPGVDLACVDLDLYHALVRSTWPSLEPATLRRAAAVGHLLRGGLAAVHWDALKYIGNEYHSLDDMLHFRQRIIDALGELGWRNGTPRSFPGAPPRGIHGASSEGVQGRPSSPFPGEGRGFPGAPQA